LRYSADWNHSGPRCSAYMLQRLKNLIHGGRISHRKGWIASILHLKPLIGVGKGVGTHVPLGQERSSKGAIRGMGVAYAPAGAFAELS
jgi:fatty acid-binding protein DegV